LGYSITPLAVKNGGLDIAVYAFLLMVWGTKKANVSELLGQRESIKASAPKKRK